MFYLVTGIVELVSMGLLAIFHSGMVTNVSGLVMFITIIMIPCANFMAVGRTSGNLTIKLILAITSCTGVFVELLALNHQIEIPDTGLRIILAYVGISSILVYVDQKRNPGHRSVESEKQDTLR